MRYTKEQIRRRYGEIYYLKVVKRLTNDAIGSVIPNCKIRTIQNALKFVNEEKWDNPSLVQMTIDGYNDDIAKLYAIRDSLFEDFNTVQMKDKYKQSRKNSTARIINEVTGQIADIRTKIARIQSLFDVDYKEALKASYKPPVFLQPQIVTMVKNADGTTKTYPNCDDILAFAESRIEEDDS